MLIPKRLFTGHALLLLWPLWELTLTETPLILVADDPTECSHGILTLLSLLAPLRPADTVDYRPYITLYEGDVKEFAAKGKAGGSIGNVMLGVTNPYLVTYVLGQKPTGAAVLHMERGHFLEKKY
jgi:hypothetical protein